jgi:cytochrome c oxidase assembly protein subunit 15
VVLITLGTIMANRSRGSRAFGIWRKLPPVLVFVQLLLGIFTVLTSTRIRIARWNIFEWMAQLHQLVAIFLLLSMVGALYFIRAKKMANQR